VDAGDHVVLVVRETAKMRDTRRRDLVHVWTVRDGLGLFLRVFKTKREAVEAVGCPTSPEAAHAARASHR